MVPACQQPHIHMPLILTRVNFWTSCRPEGPAVLWLLVFVSSTRALSAPHAPPHHSHACFVLLCERRNACAMRARGTARKGPMCPRQR